MDLNHLRRRNDYIRHDAPKWMRALWPTEPSLDWFMKAHRQQLVGAGAIVLMGREYFIMADKFEAVVRQIYKLPEAEKAAA